ncbi:DUF4097 domain-containing protein [Streptomyces sp. NPDC058637]|uniref:DUF4097 family beta strand repeat-containing protein n=1 Tax=Streptomyces sp. NPDC058637 TaxID=3346569 RepID=UPI00365A7646
MPSFDTPSPISVNAHVDAGAIRFAAADRADTVVDVTPRDARKDQDVRAAEKAEVTYSGGTLRIKTPKPGVLGRVGTVDITVCLPAGSQVEATGGWAEVRGEGRLGEVSVKTSSGDVRFGTTGPLHLTAPHGAVTVDRVEGPAEITTSSGSIRVGTVAGIAVLKNAHGTTSVGDVTGDLRVSGANGDVIIDRAHASVEARTANGTLRIAEVARGSVQLETSYGAIDVGVREGTAAWLDVSSGFGAVHNSLSGSGGPEKSEDNVEVRARTRHGNIDVRRARA